MSFWPVKGNEIMELIQLESPQLELYNSSYKINKSGIPEVLTDSSGSKVSGITLWLCNLYFWILGFKTKAGQKRKE
jgi:hypothetical protein